ncbi:hypothetical protein D3C76_1064660 [compost metagenome]
MTAPGLVAQPAAQGNAQAAGKDSDDAQVQACLGGEAKTTCRIDEYKAIDRVNGERQKGACHHEHAKGFRPGDQTMGYRVTQPG